MLLRTAPTLALLALLGATPCVTAQKGDVVAFEQESGARLSSRVLFFNMAERKAEGQIQVSWGALDWKDDYSKAIGAERFLGKRWRLGKDGWTTLDTQFDLHFGKVKVPAGLYYMTLVQQKGGKLELHLLDPAECRKMKLDPFTADAAKTATAIPVSKAAAKEASKDLRFTMPKSKADTERTLTIAFGPHMLTAPFTFKK